MDHTITSWESFLGAVNVVATNRTVYPELEPTVLSDAFKPLENMNRRVSKVFMNAVTYSSVRKWGLDVINPINDVSLLRKGIMAYAWGAELVVQRAVPDKTLIAIADDPDTEDALGAIMTLGEGNSQSKGMLHLLERVRKLESRFLLEYKEISEIIQELIRDMDNNAGGKK